MGLNEEWNELKWKKKLKKSRNEVEEKDEEFQLKSKIPQNCQKGKKSQKKKKKRGGWKKHAEMVFPWIQVG